MPRVEADDDGAGAARLDQGGLQRVAPLYARQCLLRLAPQLGGRVGVKGGTECRRDIVVEVMRAQPGDVLRREAVAAQEGGEAVRVIAGQEGE